MIAYEIMERNIILKSLLINSKYMYLFFATFILTEIDAIICVNPAILLLANTK